MAGGGAMAAGGLPPSIAALTSRASEPTPISVAERQGRIEKARSLMADQGINVARRTIAKYRDALSIPPSNERKRLV